MDTSEFDAWLGFAEADELLGRAVGRFLRASGLRLSSAEDVAEARGDVPWLAAVERALGRARKLVLIVSEVTPTAWLRAWLDHASRQQHLEVIPLIRDGFFDQASYPVLELFTPMRLPADRRQLDEQLERLVHRVRREGAALRPPVDREARPFPGLKPYGVRDGRWFFGRLRELAEGTDGLGFEAGGHRWLQVEGPAGAGKTSFARAGVVSAILRGAVVAGPPDWFVAAFRPGRAPFQALVAAVEDALADRVAAGVVEVALGSPGGLSRLLQAELPANAGLLLVVDHLDDVAWAREQGVRGAEAFDEQIATALGDAASRLLLVTTSQTAQARRTLDVLPRLAAQLAHARLVSLGGLAGPSVRGVIEGPLAMIGRRWPAPLVDRIVADAVRHLGSPGPLCWALDRLHGDKAPTEERYDALGGLHHGPGRALDARLGLLDDASRQHALTLVLALTSAGRGRDDHVVALPWAEAVQVAGGGAAGEALIRGLCAPGGPSHPEALLAVDADQARLAHADLLRLWPRLRGLLASHREMLERRDDLERAATAWHDAGRPEGALPIGPPFHRSTAADLAPEALAALEATLSARGRAWLKATRAAEATRQADASAEEARERAAAAAERGQERADAAARERALRQRKRALTLATAVLATGAVVALALAAGLKTRLDTALGDVATLETAHAEQDAVVERLRADKADLETQRAGLNDGLQRAQTLARQAAAEAEVLLAQGTAAVALADEHLALIPGGAGQYNRRTFFMKLVDGVAAAAQASPESDRLRLLLARVQAGFGDVLAATGAASKAPAAYADAVATLGPLTARPQPAPASLVALAQIHLQAAAFHARVRVAVPPRDPAEAVVHLEQAIEAWARLRTLYPDDAAHRVGLAETLARLGDVQGNLGQTPAAMESWGRATTEGLALAEAAAEGDAEPAARVGRWLGELADLEARTAQPEAAQTHYAEAQRWLDRAIPLAPAERAAELTALRDKLRWREKKLR